MKAKQTLDRNNMNDPQKKYRLGTVSINILLEGFNQFHGASLTLSSYHRCLVRMKLINASSHRTHKSRYKKKIKQR